MPYKILAVGEVLWDLLPGGKKLGGAPANFAYHCRALGAEASLVTRIGSDDLGREVLDRFETLGLPTDTVQIDSDVPTGTVDVVLGAGGQPNYTIRSGVAWDRIEAEAVAIARAASADAVCFGSLAQRAEPSRSAVLALADAAPQAALRIFDANLRSPFINRGTIEESLARSNALKLNDQELSTLATMFGLPTSAREAMSALAHQFDLTIVALTRGAGGSLLLADGAWSDHPGITVEVTDTVGAGDAFTAALVVGWLAGDRLDIINQHANAVAAYVCTQPGGTPALPEWLRVG